MPYDLKTVHTHSVFIKVQSCFLLCYCYLLFHGVNAFKIRKKQSALKSFFNYDAVAFYIQLIRRIYGFLRTQDINIDLQAFKLFGPDGIESRIPGGSCDGIGNDLIGYILPCGRNGPIQPRS